MRRKFLTGLPVGLSGARIRQQLTGQLDSFEFGARPAEAASAVSRFERLIDDLDLQARLAGLQPASRTSELFELRRTGSEPIGLTAFYPTVGLRAFAIDAWAALGEETPT